MNKVTKIVAQVLLLVAIGGLIFWLYSNIMSPVKFNKEKDIRKEVAVQRLKDIRTLEVAYKSVNGKFNSSIDSLKQFYENGQMEIVMQIGSMDDSLAKLVFDYLPRAYEKGAVKDLPVYQEAYEAGKNVVFSTVTKVPVRDTLFRDRADFCIDSLKYIPFSGKEPVQIESAVKMVSGVPVPLFEARMPYRLLLKGMNNQLRINLDAECKDQNRYEGLQVGSVNQPNNNAGNWE